MADFSVEDFIRKYGGYIKDKILAGKGDDSPPSTDQSDDFPLKWEEIGDGNINFVYRVTFGPNGGPPNDGQQPTAVVKHASTYIRCLGPNYPLTQSRLKLEYDAMCCYHKLHPYCVPAPYLYDQVYSAVLMEDLSGYNVMRKDLMDGKVDLKAIAMVMVAIATTHKMTLAKELGETQHQHYCDTFQNPVMVSITDQYIFTKPYQSADVTNKHDKLLDDEVKSLRDDEVMCQRAEDMRKIFMGVKQCLCHGDLHTGSIMANDGMAKMFDLEFAFMGPAAFDLGMFLANLVFSMIRHVCMSDHLVVELLYQTLINAVDTYGRSCGDDIWRCDDFVRDTCGFIGCELIRRVIGAAHVEDIQSIPEGELKALKLGKQFLLVTVRDTDKLTDVIVNLLKDYL